VSENVPEDWVLIMQSNSAGVIYPLEEAGSLFVNKYQPGIAMAQFVGRKLMDEQPVDAESFSFELWEGHVLLQTKSVMEGGFVMFDAIQYDKQDAGRHEYVIKEVAGDDEMVLYDGHEEIVIVQVTAVTENNGTTKVTAEVTYDDDNVVFNNWTKPGVLMLRKVVDDLRAGHENDEFRFRIRFKQENGLPLTDEMTYTIEP
jgi:pilin isopeptide linkage protein